MADSLSANRKQNSGSNKKTPKKGIDLKTGKKTSADSIRPEILRDVVK